MKEQDLQSKIVKELKSNGWAVVKTILLSKNGYPDLFAFKKGVIIFIEVKKPNGVRSKIQEYRIKELKKEGFNAEFIDSMDDLKKMLLNI